MGFETELRRYADLIAAHGLNIQPGQTVNISTETIHRDLAILIAECCYKRGAKFVNIDFADARLTKVRALHSNKESLQFVPKYITTKYEDMVSDCAANLKLLGSEDPDLLSDLEPEKMNTMRLHQHLAVKHFYTEGIGKSKVHWTVVAAATPKWGEKIFPKLKGKEACDALWQEIFKICRVDKENYLELWAQHDQTLKNRSEKLNSLKIKALHFTGPGTDLIVELSPRALFKGGGDISPRNVHFEPNVPTEEVFTTPDYRKTSGKVTATRPFLINGKLIKGLYLEFTNGEISFFKAEDGEETFREYINSDPGGKRLGEVALVGIDSPIFKSGLVFQEILYDENAACHIAVGSAYKFCLDGGATLSKEELEAIGCNESTVHTDMMISSPEVDVTATTHSEETILIICKGEWVKQFT